MSKDFKDLIWNVSEEEYRKYDALSYSLISTYQSEGFSCLDPKKPKRFSPSFSFGSAVDTLATESITKFNEKFCIIDDVKVTPSNKIISDVLYSRYKKESLKEYTDEEIILIAKEFNIFQRLKDPISKIRVESTENYYNLLATSGNRTVISKDECKEIFDTYSALKSTPYTREFFIEDNPFTKVKKYNQVKFKTILDNNIEYKCMFDIIMVDYDKKIIIPVDLKTSSAAEYKFYENFVTFHYDIQARLYTRILEKIIRADDYFRDFKVTNFVFICVSRYRKQPLKWVFDLSKEKGNISIPTYSKLVEFKDPEILGKEIHEYLSKEATNPKEITEVGYNNIVEFIKNNL